VKLQTEVHLRQMALVVKALEEAGSEGAKAAAVASRFNLGHVQVNEYLGAMVRGGLLAKERNGSTDRAPGLRFRILPHTSLAAALEKKGREPVGSENQEDTEED